MVKKRKKKRDIPITESYQIEVEDWEVYYSFGLAPKHLMEGVYWETSTLSLTGRIISPVLDKANRARIDISAYPQMDDHWQSKPTIVSAKATGWMEILRGGETLAFFCSVPSRSLPFIATTIQSGKIKYVSISGTKLKWRRGTISHLSLSTQREEE